MLVEVVRLRSKGFKIDKEALERVRPVRGHILMWDYFDQYKRKRVPVVALQATPSPGSTQLIPRMEGIRLTRWKTGGLVLVGMEQIDLSRRDLQEYPQAWWGRIVMMEVLGPEGVPKGVS